MDKNSSTRKIGFRMEESACAYLTRRGYRIIDRNFHGGRFSELDIVGWDTDGYLCFIEVKYRSDGIHGGSEGTIDYRKMRRISLCAARYLSCHGIMPDTPVRFDVVFIIGTEVSLVRDAFDYVA